MAIYVIDNKKFARRVAKAANVPYVELDPFVKAVDDARLDTSVAGKLAAAMVRQISAGTVIMGVSATDYNSSIKSVTSNMQATLVSVDGIFDTKTEELGCETVRQLVDDVVNSLSIQSEEVGE